MTLRCRRNRLSPLKWDGREVVNFNGYEVTCEELGRELRYHMAEIDAMPPEWRALVNEYGQEAEELYRDRIPVFAGGKVITAQEAERQLKSGR